MGRSIEPPVSLANCSSLHDISITYRFSNIQAHISCVNDINDIILMTSGLNNKSQQIAHNVALVTTSPCGK